MHRGQRKPSRSWPKLGLSSAIRYVATRGASRCSHENVHVHFFSLSAVNPHMHNKRALSYTGSMSTYQHGPNGVLKKYTGVASVSCTHIVLCLQERKDEFDKEEEARKRAKSMGGAFADLQNVMTLAPSCQLVVFFFSFFICCIICHFALPHVVTAAYTTKSSHHGILILASPPQNFVSLG